MNKTQIVQEIQRRYRRTHREPLTRKQIRDVIDLQLEIMHEGLVNEGRIVLTNFGVIELQKVVVRNPGQLRPITEDGESRKPSPVRYYWRFRPSNSLKQETLKTRKKIEIKLRNT